MTISTIRTSGFDLPVVRVSGDAASCGRQYGSLLRPQIQATVATYLASFRHHHGIGQEDVFALADRFGPMVAEYDPGLLAEIEGIAEGAEVPLSAILTVNARSELVHGLKAPLIDPDGCTSFFAGPPATRDGKVYIGQNWDWNPAIRTSTVILDIRREGLPRIVTMTEAGLLGKIGMNEAGIGSVINFLLADQRQFGVPVHVIRRRVLHGTHLSAAMKAVTSAQRALSANYMIGSADGQAVDIEAWPEDFAVLLTEKGTLTHANHFKRLDPARRDLGKSISIDSFLRDHRMNELLGEGGMDLGTLKAALRDKKGHPNAICRHADTSVPSGDRSETVGSIVIDLTDLKMHFCSGPPDLGDYVEIPMQ